MCLAVVNRHDGVGEESACGEGVVARIEVKVYFFLPHARPVPVKGRSCTSWFGQWSPDLPEPAQQFFRHSPLPLHLHASIVCFR